MSQSRKDAPASPLFRAALAAALAVVALVMFSGEIDTGDALPQIAGVLASVVGAYHLGVAIVVQGIRDAGHTDEPGPPPKTYNLKAD